MGANQHSSDVLREFVEYGGARTSRKAALDALDGLQEQVQTAEKQRDAYWKNLNDSLRTNGQLKEQLEALREALEWCNDHRDSERFHSVAESALNRVSSPAKEPKA